MQWRKDFRYLDTVDLMKKGGGKKSGDYDYEKRIDAGLLLNFFRLGWYQTKPRAAVLIAGAEM